MDKFHTLVQSDVLGESDDEFKKKNVFLLLNVDGSLPFPGELPGTVQLLGSQHWLP